MVNSAEIGLAALHSEPETPARWRQPSEKANYLNCLQIARPASTVVQVASPTPTFLAIVVDSNTSILNITVSHICTFHSFVAIAIYRCSTPPLSGRYPPHAWMSTTRLQPPPRDTGLIAS